MKRISIILLSFLSLSLFSQKGKNGALTVSTANVRINEFTDLTSNASIGNTILNVTASTLNANSRFTSNLAPGDLIMIIQMQGAFSKTAFTPSYAKDSTYGYIYNYANCGNYEFAEVKTITSATQIEIDCGLKFNYTSSGKVQIVRVPRYTALTIAATGTLTTDAWNGTIGGVLIAEVNGNTIINAGGVITATGLGFRGGVAVGNGGTGDSSWGTQVLNLGAEKGEGIASNRLTNVATFNDSLGKQCKGSPANGGGGGNANNCGGGGGANAGNLATYNGYGIPGAGFAAIWNLEWPGRALVTSSGGGKGGYGTSTTNTTNINTVGPNSSLWGSFARRSYGGFGGHPLDYTTGKIYLGGGGGAGHMSASQSNGAGACSGGNGGGLVYLLNYGTVTGTGTISSNGANGGNSFGTASIFNPTQGIDGAGGAGAGGTIILESAGAISSIIANANGGRGGNQVITGTGTQEGQGPGGGGSGGYIAGNGSIFTQTILGGLNGTTSATAFDTEFPMNGATAGDVGIANQTVLAALSNTHILTASANQTICANQSTTISASSTNSLATISWYNAIAGGNSVATSSTYTTPVYSTPGTYTVFAGSCPGLYRVPIIITVVASPTLAVSNATICAGQTATLTASGASTYTWNPGNVSGTTYTSSPVSSTTVSIVGSVGTCTTSSTASITLNASAAITVNSATICAGQTTTLTASGVSTYTWNTGPNTNTLSVSPASTTVYTINGTSAGCNGVNTTTVTVNSTPTLTVNSATICSGQSTLLTASGANTYTWSNSVNTNTQTVNPTSTQNYSVIGTSALGCVTSASVVANVSVTPTPTLVANSLTICAGQTATLTASGATSYTWNPGNVSGSTYTIAPSSNTFVTVLAANGTCTAQATPSITIGTGISIAVNSATICAGQATTLTASGVSTYTWNTGPNTSTLSVSPASTTVYTISGTSAGCNGVNTTTVTVNPIPTLTVNSATICSGQSTLLTASGANTYTWSNSVNTNTQTVNPTSTQNYSVIGTSALGCVASTSVVANVSVTPTPTLVANSLTICAGQTATLNASGATTYTWNPGNSSGSTYTIAPSSNTFVTVLAANGTCTAQATPSVTIGSNISITVNSATICAGQTASLTASGATTYTWNTGPNTNTLNVSPSATTIYTINGTNAGCGGTNTATVTVNPVPTLTTNTSIICTGQTATLIASGANTYTWSNGPTTSTQTVSPNVTTSYTVVGTNSFGCQNTILTAINVNVTPTPTVSINSTSICLGNTATLTALGATNYTWSTSSNSNSISVSPVGTTTYSVIGSNGACSSNATTTVTVDNTTLSTFTLATSICPSQTVALIASGSNSATTTYTWSNGTTTYSQTVAPISTTNYTVNGNSPSGCPAVFGTFTVNVNSITADFSGVTSNIATVGDVLNLTNTSTNATSINWTLCNLTSSSNNTVSLPLNDVGNCCITLLASNATCTNSITKCVDVVNQAVVSIPNVFTPNGDGKNEFFKVTSVGLKTLNCAIYDRWGLKLYEWDGLNGYWDGNVKAGSAPDGTYYYIINYTDLKDVSTSEKGFLNLFRN